MCGFIRYFLWTGWLLSSAAYADTDISFVGQFGDKAVIEVDGKQRILAVGQSSREGVRLLSVDSNHAVIEYENKKQQLGFSVQNKNTYRQAAVDEVTVWADSGGQFSTPGSINGHMVSFLVDTGATSVAMNESTANRLGIDFRYQGEPQSVVTASGVAPAHRVKLRSVRVGGIELHNVDGTVVEGGFPIEILLGMSFLSHVEMQRKNNQVRLTRHR